MKLRPLASAALFTGVTTAAMLLGSLTTPSSPSATFGTYAAQAALADEDGKHGDRGERNDENCINPAGYERGRCDRGDGEQKEHHRKHRKHHGQGSLQNATISGTVLSVNGNTAQVRLDNGRTITVDTAGTQVGVGQHLVLNGCYQNGIFVVNCNGTQNGNGNGNGYGQQQVSGAILSLSGNIVTLVGLPPVRVDITRAQANNAISGQLTIARSITAYGYSQNGTFYATSIR